MVVDDDRNICFTISSIGSYAGWTVHPCQDVQRALNAMEQFQPEIIILDYHLPFMNGLSGLPKFRRMDSSVPIIMLTVEDDGLLAERCRAAGASDFSLKPIKALDLISRVNLNLELSRLRQDAQVVVAKHLEKGMNQETLDLVLNYARNRRDYFAISETSTSLSLGYSTTHRYLNYLEEQGYLAVKHGYGKQGRPRKMYIIGTRIKD